MNFTKGSEKEIVKNSIHERQQLPHTTTETLTWPQIHNIPINEFRTEGYMTCAFPTLFFPLELEIFLSHECALLQLGTISNT